MKKFTVFTNELLAAALFMSEDESRYNLNGVNIEVAPNKAPLLVATDGRRLGVLQSLSEQPEQNAETFSLIIKRDTIKSIAKFDKSLGKVLGGSLTFEFHPSKRILIHFAGGKIVTDWEEGALVEDNYPNWRGVIPTGEKEPVQDVGVNSEFISVYAKVSKLMNVDPYIHANLYSKEAQIEVKINGLPNFYSVVMPSKTDERTDWQPEFLGLTQPAKAA